MYCYLCASSTTPLSYRAYCAAAARVEARPSCVCVRGHSLIKKRACSVRLLLCFYAPPTGVSKRALIRTAPRPCQIHSRIRAAPQWRHKRVLLLLRGLLYYYYYYYYQNYHEPNTHPTRLALVKTQPQWETETLSAPSRDRRPSHIRSQT